MFESYKRRKGCGSPGGPEDDPGQIELLYLGNIHLCGTFVHVTLTWTHIKAVWLWHLLVVHPSIINISSKQQMLDLMCGKWILVLVMNKLGHSEQQRFSPTAPAQGQRRALSVACVQPAGFKIVPGKLIVCAEQHWKPQRSCFYSILEA